INWKILSLRLSMESPPRYNVLVSDRARQMLAAHIRFLAEKIPEAARKTKNELTGSIRSLSRMPDRYPFLSSEFISPNKYHKMYIEKWYLVLYQIKGHIVYVEYIVDCRQDYQWLIR